jgi:hypothetical protein
MSEIYEDIKVNLVESVGNLGINLTSTDTRINHTKSGKFDMTSNGVINISTGNSEINTQDYNYNISGNINIGTKDATSTTVDPISINIIGGKGTVDIEGTAIYIESGSGGQGLNSSAGEISIRSGNGQGTGTGGQITITAGFGTSGDGGDIYIQAGNSNNNAQSGTNGGNIIIESGNGGIKCGDVNVFLGPSDANDGASIPFFGPTGRFNINYGAFKLAIFEDTDIRDDRIPNPEKGDMCFVNNKINVYTGSGEGEGWKTLAFDP